MAKHLATDQIVQILEEAKSGVSIKDLCNKYDVSESAIYNWRKKIGSLDNSLIKRIDLLEAENLRLKILVADFMLKNKS